MTPRERVYHAIQFRDTDVVPYQVSFTAEAKQRMVDYLADPSFESRLGNHLATVSHRRVVPWTEVEPGLFRDEWDVVWNRTIDKDIGIVCNRVLAEPNLSDYHFPEPEAPELLARYPEFVAENADRFRIASIGMSLFERAWALRGFDQLLMDMYESPEFVHELFDRITEFNLAQVDLALRFDIDCVWFGDDWGTQGGLIMSPALWREFIKPRAARMYGRARAAGKYVMIHSCGKTEPLFSDLVEMGVNIYNPFQPEVMDLHRVKADYMGRMSFYGGIGVQRLLPYGTPAEIRSEVRNLLKTLGSGGGYIASTSHVISPDVPPENVAAMIEVLTGQ